MNRLESWESLDREEVCRVLIYYSKEFGLLGII